MSAPSWKPGDVALNCGNRVFRLSDGRWQFVDGKGIKNFDYDVRPLVVIDPEDREQVERLTKAYCEQFSGRGAPLQPEETWHMQEALRSLVAPAKPEEPQGLGAVVEDAEGSRWLRWHAGPRFWVAHPGSNARRWDDINAVRVLSEGWRA